MRWLYDKIRNRHCNGELDEQGYDITYKYSGCLHIFQTYDNLYRITMRADLPGGKMRVQPQGFPAGIRSIRS
jgi:hypothetical protein